MRARGILFNDIEHDNNIGLDIEFYSPLPFCERASKQLKTASGRTGRLKAI